MMQKIQKIEAMFTPVLLFAFAGTKWSGAAILQLKQLWDHWHPDSFGTMLERDYKVVGPYLINYRFYL